VVQAAAAVQVSKKEEQALLEQIRKAFNAKHVVRVCSMYESDRVLDGARRLLEAADVIRQTVDLSGASLAIDDCYEVWGSGFISIPYDFTLQELQPQLMRLLGSGRPDSPGAAAAAAAAAAGASTSGNGSSSSSSSGAYSAAAASRTSRGASSSGSSGSSIRERWQEHQARQQQQQHQQPRSSLTPPGPQGLVQHRHSSSHSSQQPRACPARAVGQVPGLGSWLASGRSAAAAAGAAARRVGSSSQQRRVQRCAAVRF
jgi:hypothetical protein